MKTFRLAAGLATSLLLSAPAVARPVVVELFTSQACSSCPPAEALLRRLKAGNADILPLSFHVTYWNGPAWTDEYSLQAATDRQSWYAGLAREDVYTPEVVVDGTARMVGSDAKAVTIAIDAATARAAGVPVSVPVSVQDGPRVAVKIGAGHGAGTVWLIGYDPAHVTKIGGGENGGATVAEVNVVRSIMPLGLYRGAAETLSAQHPDGARLAVLVQRDDGGIVGAAD